jgi:Bacteriophage tail sheath protein
MTITSAPGVYVTEQLQALQSPAQATSPSTACFVGEHYRGPTYPVLITSWSQFVTYFGGFNPYFSASVYSPNNPFSSSSIQPNPYLPFAVYEFFANGGQRCWVYRVVNTNPGPAGTSAAVNVVNNAATPQVSMTFTVGAFGLIGNPGAWGNGVSVQIATSSAGSGSFSLSVLYQGSLVENWPDLSILPTSPRYFITMMNSAQSGSQWVYAVNNDPLAVLPPQAATYPFTGGSDPGGSWTTQAAHQPPSPTDRSAAVTVGSPLDNVPGMLNINLPGESTSTVLAALAAYTNNSAIPGTFRPYTFAVIDPAQSMPVSGSGSIIAALGGASTLAVASCAVYYPWVSATDPSTASAQATVWLPPGGFVLGVYALTDKQRGPWKAAAGKTAVLQNVVGAEQRLSSSSLGLLNTNLIDALRTLSNGQVVIWGARTQLGTYPSKYVNIRRTLNYIESSLASLLDFAIFEDNDRLLWGNISNACNSFLGAIYSANGFAGDSAAQAYFVICDTTNNTPTTIQSGVVNTTVGVALEYPAEFLLLNVVQVQSTGTTTVTVGG